MSTASTILSYIEGVTKIDRSTIGVPGLEEIMLLNVLDKANREYYNKFLLGGGEPSKTFELETGGTIIASTTITGALTTASVTIGGTDTSSFFASGIGAVWTSNEFDIFAYTSNATNTLSGVTGLGFSHALSDELMQLYPLPANFGSFRSSDDCPDGVVVNGVPYTYVTGIPLANEFRTYTDGTLIYLQFPRGMTGIYGVDYNKIATPITSTASLCDVPLDDEDFLVYRGAEYVYSVLGTAPEKLNYAAQKANKIVLDALKRRNVGKRLKVGRQWNSFNRTGYPPSEAIGQILL